MPRFSEQDQQMETRTLASQAALVSTVAKEISQLIENHDGVQFNLVVSGGGLGIRTIEELGKLINTPELLRIMFCDERYVAAESPDRNEHQALSVWPLISNCEFLRYPQPPTPLHGAGQLVSEQLSRLYGELTAEKSVFDLVLLGVGEDGHIASLFPNALHPAAWIVAEGNSPKPPRERLSMSYQAINRAERVWFVVGGSAKAEVLRGLRNGKDLPVGRVRGAKETIWWLDQELSDAL